MMASMKRKDAPSGTNRDQPRQGFLPIHANTFDRVFISIVLFVAIHLLWFRFLEASISINVATLISLIVAFIIIRWG
jgi:predicted small integral membrane protein